MPFCPNGGEPVPGAPDHFVYEGTDLTTFLPGWAGFFALQQLGLSPYPVSVVDFCRADPPTDFPTEQDIAGISDSISSVLTGAYGRFGNLIKAQKWATYCQCKVPPSDDGGVPVPAGFSAYYRDQFVDATGLGAFFSAFVADPLPLGTIAAAFRKASGAWPVVADTFALVDVQLVQGTEIGRAAPFPTVYDVPGSGGGPDANGWYTVTWVPGEHVIAHPVIKTSIGEPNPGSGTFDIAFQWSPVPFEPPPPLEAPPGYPAGGVCAAPTLADLCKQLSAIDGKLDALTALHSPHEVTPDPLPTPTEPNPDGPGLKPLVKPPKAIGAIITCTSIPSIAARYGTSPVFYPDLGHVAQVTEFGPMPSQLIKHNPLVLLPLGQQVVSVELDLLPGVTATATWLYPTPEAVPPTP